MPNYSKLRIVSGGIPTTIDLAGAGNILEIDGLQINSLTASKPLKLNASKVATTGDIDLTGEVTGVLPIANGGTNSSTALNNNRIMKSSGGAIVEHDAITASRALISDANGIPTHSSVTSVELGYVSGVTSAIQDQLDGKLALAGGTMAGDIAMGGNKVTGLGTPSAADDAATKGYADQIALTGGVVKEATLVAGQLDDTQGILAAEVVYFNTNPVADDTIIITDGTNSETYTFKVAEAVSGDVLIGATPADTMTNLAQAINDDSAYWSGQFSADGLDDINTDGVVVVYEKTAGASVTSRIYGVWGTQANCKVVEYNGQTQYSTEKAAVDLPSSDPAAVRFGFNRQNASLTNGEIHLILDTDVIRSWNADGGVWYTLSGSGSLPDATSVDGGTGIKGKLTVDSLYGAALTSGVFRNKVDNSTIEFDGTGNFRLKDGGITDAKINASANIATSKLADSANFLLANASHALTDAVRYTYGVAQTFTNDGDLVTKKFVTDSISAATPEGTSFTRLAGEAFAANSTFLVRYAVSGETAGSVYKATSDHQNAPNKHYALGIIQTTDALTGGETVTVIKFTKSIALKSGDSVIGSSAADNGKPLWLNKDGAFSLDPATGITSGETYASRPVGTLVSYNATNTSELISIDVAVGAWFGYDIAA